MESETPIEVTQAMTILHGHLGAAFPFDALVQFIALVRQKPLKIEEFAFPPGVTGCCFALEDADVILVRPQLDPRRALLVKLHECAHFLLRHIPRVSAEFAGVSYQTFSQATMPLVGVVCRDRMITAVSAREQSAETLATLLLASVEQLTTTTPRAIIELYGFGKE